MQTFFWIIATAPARASQPRLTTNETLRLMRARSAGSAPGERLGWCRPRARECRRRGHAPRGERGEHRLGAVPAQRLVGRVGPGGIGPADQLERRRGRRSPPRRPRAGRTRGRHVGRPRRVRRGAARRSRRRTARARASIVLCSSTPGRPAPRPSTPLRSSAATPGGSAAAARSPRPTGAAPSPAAGACRPPSDSATVGGRRERCAAPGPAPARAGARGTAPSAARPRPVSTPSAGEQRRGIGRERIAQPGEAPAAASRAPPASPRCRAPTRSRATARSHRCSRSQREPAEH